MPDPLREFLERADEPTPLFAADELDGWSDGDRDGLERAGVLADAAPAEVFTCDSCPADHTEEVVWIDVPGAPPRAFIPCPENHRVRLDPARLRRWAVRFGSVAKWLVGRLPTAGGSVERVPGRVYKIGTFRAGGRAWVGWAARGLGWRDGPAVVESVPELRATNAVVFVPAAAPPPAVWSADRPPVVVPLADVLALRAGGLVLDRPALESAFTPVGGPVAPTSAQFPTPPGAKWEDVSLTVEDLHLRVRVGDVVRRFRFDDAGFADLRAKGQTNKSWTVLALIARRGGILPAVRERAKGTASAHRQRVSEVRAALRRLLALDDDPFFPIERGTYRARFVARSEVPGEYPTPPGTEWPDVTIAGNGGNGVVVQVTDAGPPRTYSFADLSLTDRAGRTSAAGAALSDVLSGGGTVAAPDRDRGMLALGDALSRFFHIDSPPFQYDSTAQLWVARFDVPSQ